MSISEVPALLIHLSDDIPIARCCGSAASCRQQEKYILLRGIPIYHVHALFHIRHELADHLTICPTKRGTIVAFHEPTKMSGNDTVRYQRLSQKRTLALTETEQPGFSNYRP